MHDVSLFVCLFFVVVFFFFFFLHFDVIPVPPNVWTSMSLIGAKQNISCLQIEIFSVNFTK